MKDKRSLLVTGIIICAVVGILIFKFAVPGDAGSTSKQIGLQQETAQQSSNGAQSKGGQIDSAAQKKDAANNDSSQSGNATASDKETKQTESQQPAREVLPVWYLFRSTTCIPCIEMQKTMDALRAEFKGKVDFVAVDVNDPANRELLMKYQIRLIPTTFLYDRNKNLYFQYGGALSVDEMRGKLQALAEIR